jgi:hypothetical protein
VLVGRVRNGIWRKGVAKKAENEVIDTWKFHFEQNIPHENGRLSTTGKR